MLCISNIYTPSTILSRDEIIKKIIILTIIIQKLPTKLFSREFDAHQSNFYRNSFFLSR